MHAGLSCGEHAASAHPERGEHGHSVVAIPAIDGALHDAGCAECVAHTSTTMVCAMLLFAVAGALGVRVLRRLLAQRNVALVLEVPCWRWIWPTSGPMARAPNLHALQVMRC